MRMTLLALLAAPLPALALDLPPVPPVGAPVEERLYLASDSVDPLDLLVARVTCVAFQRAAIAARLDDGLLARGWTGEADRLWRLSEALTAFEATHIRPLIDEETEEALLDAYAPGLRSARPPAPRAHALRPQSPGPQSLGPQSLGPQTLRPDTVGADDPGTEDPRSGRCGSFADSFVLRRVLG
jgi:hypothetical protein